MKFTYIILLTFLSCLTSSVYSQNQKPKLVIGIVVDQMRYDYLYRYYDKYGEGGFKRLLNQGFNCRNAHYNYIPTETGPGHASIYTGTSPAYHGIVANTWFENGKSVYCAEDNAHKIVGSETGKGNNSPKNMLVTTLGDQLKLATAGKAKVFGISLKDRSAVMPG